MRKSKIYSCGKVVGDIIEQHKSSGIFVANVTINMMKLSGIKSFNDLMHAPVLNVPDEIIRAETKDELDSSINDFIGKHIKDEFEVVEV